MLQNLFSKYLKKGICKIKQYLNYILMIIKHSSNPTDILKSAKKFYENLYTKETTSTTATTEFITKIPNTKKISN